MVKLIPMLMKLAYCEFRGASVVHLRNKPQPFMDLYGFTVYLCIGNALYKDELELIRNLQAVFACLNIKILR